MSRFVIPLLSLFLVLASHFPLLSAETLTINNLSGHFSIGRNIEYIEDPSGTFDINHIAGITDGWKSSSRDNINLGFTKSVYWFKVTLDIKTSDPRYLEIDYPLLDSITLYYPSANGGYTVKTAGDRTLFKGREISDRRFLFRLDLPEGKHQIFLSIKTTGSLAFTPALISGNDIIKRASSELPVYGFYYGIIFVMMLFNIFLFISLRERMYIVFSIYLLFFIFYDSSLNGLAFQYLWPGSPWAANNLLPFFMPQCISWATLFCAFYVDTPGKHSWLFKFTLYVVIIPLFILSFIAFTGNTTLSLRISSLFSFIGIIVLFFLGWVLFFKKNKENNTVMIAFLALTIGILLYTFKSSGHLPPMFLTNWGTQIGIIFCIMIFSLSMVHKLNMMKKDLVKLNTHLKETEKTAVDRASYLEDAVAGIKTIADDLYNVSGELSIIGVSFEKLSTEQAATSEEMSASFEELTTSNERIFESTVKQSDEGKRTRELVKILGDSQGDVYRVSQKVVEGINVITESANSTEANLSLMVEMMEHIDRGGKSIDNITGLIDDITDRINLLSLNAAIEAARAGEAGRGFSVVADEIGKLAAATSDNSKEISVQLRNMIADITSGKNIVEKTKISLETIFTRINDINKSIEDTKVVLTAQGSALHEVKDQADLMENLSGDIASSTKEHSVSMEENIKVVNRLSEIAEEVASSSQIIIGFTKSIRSKSTTLEDLIKNIS